MKIGYKHLAMTTALLAAAPAGAQVWHNSMPAPPVGIPTQQNGWGVGTNHIPNVHVQGRWGGMIGGRWEGGVRAPGGWGAYRRPARGWQLPPYWMGGGFQIHDFHLYGLRRPPQGYFWVRYYDDAVLVDPYGRVDDWTGGIAWDGGAYADADVDYGYGGAVAAASASASGGAGGTIMPIDPNAYYGVQGGYAPPAAGGPPVVQTQGCPCSGYGQGYQYQQGGYGYGHGYGSSYGHGAGYYYGAPATTTVVISQGAASVTTTTTETIEEEVIGGGEEVVEYVETYRAPRPVYRAPRPVYRAPDKRVYRTPAPVPDKRVYRTPAPAKRVYRK